MTEAERLATTAAKAAVEAVSDSADVEITQIITIVTLAGGDTALAEAGAPDAIGPEAVVNTLLTHTTIAVERMGGTLSVFNLPKGDG